MKTLFFKSGAAAAALILSCASQAGAVTLSVTNGTSGNFGRTTGTYVFFETTANANWSASPVNGQSYSVDSVSFIKNNADASVGALWVGLYSSFTAGVPAGSPGSLAGFLGASTASVAWGAAAVGTTFTWSFSGINYSANPGQRLYVMFQGSADPLTVEFPVAEGAVAIRRMPDGTNDATAGAGIIQGGGAGFRPDRAPFINLNVTPVPEPSHMALMGIGAVALLRRRRIS